VSQKTIHLTFAHNFGKCRPISKILPLSDSEEILYTVIIKILHLTLSIFLHYLVKLENCNCWRFQWHIACETSEYTLQHMRPLK